MLTLEILHTDIAQMDVDRIVCPIHMDLTPAYEAGKHIFFAAGYDQLQKAILDANIKTYVTGFVAPCCQLKVNSLFLIKIQGDKEMHVLRWHESAIRSSLSSRKRKPLPFRC